MQAVLDAPGLVDVVPRIQPVHLLRRRLMWVFAQQFDHAQRHKLPHVREADPLRAPGIPRAIIVVETEPRPHEHGRGRYPAAVHAVPEVHGREGEDVAGDDLCADDFADGAGGHWQADRFVYAFLDEGDQLLLALGAPVLEVGLREGLEDVENGLARHVLVERDGFDRVQVGLGLGYVARPRQDGAERLRQSEFRIDFQEVLVPALERSFFLKAKAFSTLIFQELNEIS